MNSHSPSKSAKTPRDGDKRGHLAQAQHGDKDNGADDGVGDEDGRRAARGQGFARAQEQTRADGAPDGNHLDLARREGAAEEVGLDGTRVRVGAGVDVIVGRVFAHVGGVDGFGVVKGHGGEIIPYMPSKSRCG